MCVAPKVEKVERMNETGNGMAGKIDRNENVAREREREQERNEREMREKWRSGRTSKSVTVALWDKTRSF